GHPRGPQPPGPAHVRGDRAPGAAAGADPDRPAGRPAPEARGVAGARPRGGPGAGGGRCAPHYIRAVTPAVRALRGATTVDADTPEQVHERVGALVNEMLDRNDVDKDALISVIFTATDDINCMFPAAAARAVGLGDVPLLCARE